MLEGGWGSSDSVAGLVWWQSPATSPEATAAVFALGRALSQHKGDVNLGPATGAGLGRLLPLSFERPQSFRSGDAARGCGKAGCAWHRDEQCLELGVEKAFQIQWWGGHWAVGKHLAGQEQKVERDCEQGYELQ